MSLGQVFLIRHRCNSIPKRSYWKENGGRAMNVLKGFCITVVVLLATTSTAWASRNQCTGGSDNATWAATGNNSISLAAGSGAGALGINMTSPACLNSY